MKVKGYLFTCDICGKDEFNPLGGFFRMPYGWKKIGENHLCLHCLNSLRTQCKKGDK